MAGWALAAAAIVVGLAACSVVRLGDIEPPPGRRVIVDIAIVGNERVAASDIVAELSSQAQGLSVPASDALVDMAEIGIDARRIESILAAHGHFRARVRRYWVEDGPNRTATVHFEVEEGPPSVVSEVAFEGLAPERLDEEGKRRLAEAREQLEEIVAVSEGEVWRERDYLDDLSAIARAFRERGFVHVAVAGDNYVSRQRNAVAVYYRVRHGPLTRASEVRIVGNEVVEDARILRRSAIEPGDIIEPRTLRVTEQRVYDLGMFFGVQARAVREAERGEREEAIEGAGVEGASAPNPSVRRRRGRPGERSRDDDAWEDLPEAIPVEILVQETPEWEFSVGVAGSTDLARTELRLPLLFQERNLFDVLHRVRASFAPKLIFPDVSVTSSDARFGWNSELSYTVPSFFEELVVFEASGRYDRDASQDVGADEIGASIGVSRPIITELTARVGLNAAFFRYFDSAAVSGLAPSVALDRSLLIFGAQDLITYVDARLVLDLRDGVYDARSGFYASVAADFALPIVSDIEYVRLNTDLRGYIYVGPALTIALRARVGHNFFPRAQGTPKPARFLGGGQASHRGFGANQMGSYICGDPVVDVQGRVEYLDVRCGESATDRTYIGGNYFWDSSAELRFYFTELWGAVVFADVGQLWSRPEDVAFDDLAVAVGPGLRLFTPVGPVRADLGLLVVGDEALDLQFHFSLGQAF